MADPFYFINTAVSVSNGLFTATLERDELIRLLAESAGQGGFQNLVRYLWYFLG
jgi:hypothetical protein